MKNNVIIVGGKKAVIYDLHDNYEVHFLSSDINQEVDVLNLIYYLTEEGFLPEEKPVGIKGDFIKSSFLTSTMGVSHKLKVKI